MNTPWKYRVIGTIIWAFGVSVASFPGASLQAEPRPALPVHLAGDSDFADWTGGGLFAQTLPGGRTLPPLPDSIPNGSATPGPTGPSPTPPSPPAEAPGLPAAPVPEAAAPSTTPVTPLPAPPAPAEVTVTPTAPVLPGDLPNLPPSEAQVSPAQAEALKGELLELQRIAMLLNQKITDLTRKLDLVAGGNGQVYPAPPMPEAPGGLAGGPGAPGLIPPGGPGAPSPDSGETPPAPATPGATAPTAAEPPKLVDLKYPITTFKIGYVPDETDKHLPPVPKLEEIKIPLKLGSKGYSAKGKTKLTKKQNQVVTLRDLNSEAEENIYNGEALQTIYQAIAKTLNERGLYGILVLPNAEDIDYTSGQDLRAGRKELRIQIFTSRVSQVRTVDRGVKPGENAVDTAKLKWLKLESPLQEGDLLRKPPLESFVGGLNRVPGRRVDVAINAGEQQGQIVLDYIVRQEARPFHFYAQASNTGTNSTGEWRIRGGFEYRDLFGHDDALNLDYITSPDFESQAFIGSYSRPILPPDKLKLRIYGTWGKFTASDVGFDLQNFNGESSTAGLALTTKLGSLFGAPLDLFVGAEYRHISVTNSTFPQEGSSDFFVPYVGLLIQQATDKSTFFASLQLEHNFPEVFGTEQTDTDKLGRFNTDVDFTIGKYAAGLSFYLEPIIFGGAWKKGDPWWKSTLANELAFSVRGQYTFEKGRLIPQFEDVIGGFTTVRGYPEALTAGDSSVIGSAEYRIHVPRLFKPFDVSAKQREAKGLPPAEMPPQFSWRPPTAGAFQGRPDWDLIVRGFVDIGLTFNNERIRSAEENETLLGTGVGVELVLSRYASLRMDYGIALKPQGDQLSLDPVEEGDGRFHFIFSLMW